MSNLRNTLEALAARFAESVIDALRSASLEEITGVTSGARGARPRAAATETSAKKRGGGGRLARRTADDIQGMVQTIVDLVAKHEGGLRAEQIRASLGVDAKELPRPLAEAVASGALTKSGQKRATTYSVGSGGSTSSRPAKRRGRRAKRG